MDSLNQIVAENIQYYRNRMKWTQAELAERIHYSDKSVSKWERGEGMPDLAVCTLLADLFGVTVDDLIRRHEVMPQPKQTRMSFNHRIITALSLVGVLAIALILYIVLEDWEERYRVFIYALPVMSLVVLVLNSIWGKRMANLYIIS
ncbi:MAG TPA: hypothetical protein DCY75_01205, partial [Clostridiales bacterium]|nr:hypothetical protein [Clostridiales bacterium]